MRKMSTLVAVAAIMVMAPAAGASAPEWASESNRGTTPDLWIVKAGDETYGQAVLATLTDSKQNRDNVLPTVEAMAAQAQLQGSNSETAADARALTQAAAIIKSSSGTSEAAQLKAVSSELDASIERIRNEKLAAGSLSAAASSDAIGVQAIRGQKISNGFAWEHFVELVGTLCNPVCQNPPKDRLTVRYVTNPGGVTSRIDHNVTYFPSTGGFRNIVGARTVLCGGTTACGTNRDALPSAGAGSENVSSIPSQKGKNIRHRNDVTATYFQSGQTKSDAADTGLAYCYATVGDNRCRYS